MFQVLTEDGKYSTTVHEDGSVSIERYRQPWRVETGDSYLLSLLYHIEALQGDLDSIREEKQRMEYEHEDEVYDLRSEVRCLENQVDELRSELSSREDY